MNAFVSWSGGKDCLYALHRFLKKDPVHSVSALLNMLSPEGGKSRSHGLGREIIKAQADAVGFPILQVPVRGGYEASFKEAILGLKERDGVDAGVFGDIYLEAHREWIERVCGELGVTPFFPLWGVSTSELVRNFVADGYRTVIVAVRKGKLPASFLGKVIDRDFISKCEALGLDPCGEEGEYHTFTFSGPLFKEPVNYRTGAVTEDDKHHYLEIKL